MSYILDALRRAERERDTGKAPSVESLNRGVTEVDRARVPPSVWILAIATTVIAGAALAILLWHHTPPSSAQGEAPPTPRPVVRATPEPARAHAHAEVPATIPAARQSAVQG